MKLKNIITHPSELKRTVKAFLTFYKYLFNGNNRENKEKFDRKIRNVDRKPDNTPDKESAAGVKKRVLEKDSELV